MLERMVELGGGDKEEGAAAGAGAENAAARDAGAGPGPHSPGIGTIKVECRRKVREERDTAAAVYGRRDTAA